MTMTFLVSWSWPFGTRYVEVPEYDIEQGSSRRSEPDEDAHSSLARETSLVSLLQYYTTPGIPPPSSRVDPLLSQEVRKPLRIFDLWKFGYFAASKVFEVANDIVVHYVWGPRRPSWGIEMTLISCFMRNNTRHSQLADITTIRALMQIGGFVPLPSDAMVTPLAFRVKRRGLRGLLAEHDAREDGRREITGEWVVGKRLWQRLQSEWKAIRSDKDSSTSKCTSRVVLYLHGGAYYVFSAATHRLITISLSKFVGARVFAIDYRLAPETRFPGPLHDAVSAYFRLLDDLHITPDNILIAGDSAGGGLALGLLMYLRDNSYPMPSGAILMSPWVDLTMSCDSWDSNACYDVVPIPNSNDHLNPVACYLGREGMEKYLTHPYASPLFGDFNDLPPMLIQCGDAEVLRDEVTLLAHKAAAAGVYVKHELFQDAVHVFQMFPFLDAAQQSFRSCRDFIRNVLPRHQYHLSHPPESSQLRHEIGNSNSRIVRGDGVEVSTEKSACEELVADFNMQSKGIINDDTEVDVIAERGDGSEATAMVAGKPSPQQTYSQFPRPHSRDGILIGSDSHRAVSPSPRPLSGSTNYQVDSVQFNFSPLDDPMTRSSQQRKTYAIDDNTYNAHSLGLHDQFRGQMSLLTPHSPLPANGRRRPNPVTATDDLVAPTPMIRSRHRATSHPDMVQLCREWAQGPANQTTTYRPE